MTYFNFYLLSKIYRILLKDTIRSINLTHSFVIYVQTTFLSSLSYRLGYLFFYYICDGQQFHQYQQNQQLPLSPQITRKAMKYGIGNPDPGFMTGSKCDGI